MKAEAGSFFSGISTLLKEINEFDAVPFYANGFPTNDQVYSRLKPEEQFLHDEAIEVRRGLRSEYRYRLDADHFFQDRLIRAVNSMLDEGVQTEKWAY